jgi:hypothetical protein
VRPAPAGRRQQHEIREQQRERHARDVAVDGVDRVLRERRVAGNPCAGIVEAGPLQERRQVVLDPPQRVDRVRAERVVVEDDREARALP